MRVLVTRAPDDAARTAVRLAALGHDTVMAPVVRIVPTNAARPAGAWDALIVTSAHAGPALADWPEKSCPVFAVGERTAAAARQAGLSAVAVAGGDARALAALVLGRLGPGRSLLHAAGRHRKGEPEASLRAAGYRVVPWEVYEARAADGLPPAAAEALGAGRIGAVLHFSRRSAELLMRLAGEAGLAASLRTVPHLCLSADVASALKALDVPTLVAAHPGEEALLALLAKLA